MKRIGLNFYFKAHLLCAQVDTCFIMAEALIFGLGAVMPVTGAL
jgi:hypothetical protein